MMRNSAASWLERRFVYSTTVVRLRPSPRISPDVMPGVVMAPSGYWHRSNRKGATVHALTPPAFADLGRAPTFSDVLVQVGKI